MKCLVCGKRLEDNEAYEYRGSIACDEHFDGLIEKIDAERSGISNRAPTGVVSVELFETMRKNPNILN